LLLLAGDGTRLELGGEATGGLGDAAGTAALGGGVATVETAVRDGRGVTAGAGWTMLDLLGMERKNFCHSGDIWVGSS